MNVQQKFCLWFFTVVAVFVGAVATCWGQNMNISDYVGEFEKKWNEYLYALRNVEGNYHYKDIRDGKLIREFTNHVVCAYPLYADIRGPFDTPTYVDATGKEYRFSLERSSPDEDLVVTNISKELPYKGDSSLFPKHFADSSSQNADPNAYAIFNKIGVGLFGIDSNPNLPYMITSEWVQIHEISLVDRDKEKRLFVSFDYKQKSYALVGKVFLTTDFFLVTEGEFHVVSGLGIEDVKIKVEYDNETYKVPLPRNHYCKNSYKLVVNGEPREGILETERTFDLRETDPKSSKYFTLPGYGFPAPDFDERRPRPFRYVLVIVGTLFIIYALWQMYRRREKQ